ncbi:MAG: GNAT family acetyltransferase [miscellaneous Crenarchaeota group-6 archaeon AD8-1]|nr:MAG: GNAT family acetyltransferase [miscellaneous Crenarchaeota group-6 archaeon AD8-1]
MIRELSSSHFQSILEIINKAASVYKGVIPDDRYKKPYMSAEELEFEIEDGVRFFGWIEQSKVVGVMGIQFVTDVTLIRHAYVFPKYQKKGIGTILLRHLLGLTKTQGVLVGTWIDAIWAIRFYEKQGFELVSQNEKDFLLRKYWKIPDRQIETSVVLRFNSKS